MAENSKIQWTDHTFNPWMGCTKVSPACEHCYAETQANFRQKWGVKWGPGQPRKRTTEENWKKPLSWNKNATKRLRVFCASLADVFDSEVDQSWRDDLWQLIDKTPNLDWLILTKRIENVEQMVPWTGSYPDNVWLGASVENEEWAAKRLPILCRLPAQIRFISAEPLLGDFAIPQGIDWVITGGESGKDFRSLNVEHVRSLRDQCQRLRIPFFFKQKSAVNPHKLDRLLDGREWNEYPMKEFPEIKKREVYEFENREYVRVGKKEGFEDPQARRFRDGKRVSWFVPVRR